MYDCHIHSINSHDGRETIDDICKAAIKIGLSGIAISDHTLPAPYNCEEYENIKKSIKEARECAEKYKDKLTVITAFESDDRTARDGLKPFYDMEPDFVLGSVHSTMIFAHHFSHTPYKNLFQQSDIIPDEIIEEFLVLYYNKLKNKLDEDIDSVAHITYPFRYLNGVSDRNYKTKDCFHLIEPVLKKIIETDRSLELNTSGKANKWNEFMPDEYILRRYYELGGRDITLGSDAHRCENIAVGFGEARDLLKSIGFTHACYYLNRKKHKYEL